MEKVTNRGGWGEVKLEERKIYTLAYADDVVLIAEKEDGMRSMIERLKGYLEKKELELNRSVYYHSELPENRHLGIDCAKTYFRVPPYIARVSRCNHCFRFGHIQNNYKNQPRCVHCGDKGYIFFTDNCPRVLHPSKCANCQGEQSRLSSLVTKALLSINLAHSLNHSIFGIKQKLYEIKSAEFKNSIVWIPAHSGILGNEMADYLAKKVIFKGQIDFPRKRYYDTIIKSSRIKAIAKESNTSVLLIITLKPWFYKLKLNQETYIAVGCRPLLLMDHRNKMQITFFRAVLITTNKESCLYLNISQLAKHKKTSSFGIQEILKNPSSGIIHALYSFLKSSNLNI
ncbi:hypothetical protein ACFW04_003705 [Cataglyphis niger]